MGFSDKSPSMKITIRQIESFLAVAEFGSFSAASRRMNTAQPALSQAIKDLEAELAVRLFDRTTRRVELTDAGREFRHSAAKVVEELEHAVDNIHDLAERRRGRLRIAAPPLLAAVVLPQAIVEFRSRFPGISVHLADVGTEQIIESVRTGKADCGLGTFSPAEDGIERMPLMRDSLMLFCGVTSAFSDVTSVSWRELENQPLITLTRDSGIRLLVEIGFETAEIPLKPVYEVAQITTAIALVEAGLGVAVLPTYALAAVGHRQVTGKLLTDPGISRDVVMIHATGRSVSPAVTAFATVVRRYAQQLTPR
jgi:DNA-binding transcriptional LysR family regulator